MINLKARFTNEDAKLWPGQFVTVALILSIQKGRRAHPGPGRTARPQGQVTSTWSRTTRAVMTPVVMGMRLDDEVVIDKGVNAGDVVVVEGMLRLYPGRDRPRPATATERTRASSPPPRPRPRAGSDA